MKYIISFEESFVWKETGVVKATDFALRDCIRDHITGASIRTVVEKCIEADFSEDTAEPSREFSDTLSAVDDVPGIWRNDIPAGVVSWVTDFLGMI